MNLLKIAKIEALSRSVFKLDFQALGLYGGVQYFSHNKVSSCDNQMQSTSTQDNWNKALFFPYQAVANSIELATHIHYRIDFNFSKMNVNGSL